MTPGHRTAGLCIIGDELMHGIRNDTNGTWLSHELTALGFDVVLRITVGDNLERIMEALHRLKKLAAMIIITGGLGPTHDDVTREAVAQFLKVPLVEHPETHDKITTFYDQRGIKPPPLVMKMAQVLDGAEVFANFVGVAPGQWWQGSGHTFILLPGPPAELQGLFLEAIKPRLMHWIAWEPPRMHRFRIAGLRESQTAAIIESIRSRYPEIQLSILPSPGQVDLELSSNAELAKERFQQAIEEFRKVLGIHIFTEIDEQLEDVIGRMLAERKQTLAVAESCTGGLLGHRITNHPGSSEYFMQGVVVYSNEAKVKILGVLPEVLEQYGAVSEPTAKAMAEGLRIRAETDWAVAITGIAGPTGGSPEKPVGTVHVAVSGPQFTHHHVYGFTGTREQIKWESTQVALDMLRRALLEDS